ncbi:MAG: nicotinate phosphoribosyltransferase [Clostridiales bacterium]|nr:nicotinate phosphoribosyltransferase [Clostridiales bacterium]
MYNNSVNLSATAFLTDFYELMMAGGYISGGREKTLACFDLFYRNVPDNGGFAVMAGVEQLIRALSSLSFSEEDIDFCRDKGFSEKFTEYLKNFRFECDVWAIPEGTPIFPGEPIVKVRGPILQAQLIETLLLNCINHQTLIATKANRIVRAAQGRKVAEFGSRRAHGFDAALYGARAAYIGGCDATSCTPAAQLFGIPCLATMAHSWVQSFPSELEAMCAYASEYPIDCILLVDTYDTLRSGVPNAIEAFKRELLPRGYRPTGIRIDSGDLTYLSKKARKMLDEAGFPDCDIMASNSLDEGIIRDMLIQGAKVDSFGVGERLITSASSPMFSGVYKLSAVERDGKMIPAIKISENVSKITTPCEKRLWRLFDMSNGKAIADVMTLDSEDMADVRSYELFDPDYTWKRKTVEGFVARELLVPIFKNGECVYRSPSLTFIKAYCAEQVGTLWEEVLRYEKPHNYYVDLSQALWDEKNSLIEAHRNQG